MSARCEAGYWKWQFESSRRKRLAAVEQWKEARRIGWYKADGGCKDMMARIVMLAMHRDGPIELPPPKWRQNRPGPITFRPDTEPPPLPPPTTLDAVRPLRKDWKHTLSR